MSQVTTINYQPWHTRGSGRTDLIEATERGISLLESGMPYNDACKAAGMNTNNFSVCRRIVVASKRTDLDEFNAPIVAEAMAHLRLGRLSTAYTIFKKGDRAITGVQFKGQHTRTKMAAFAKAVDLVANTCEHCTDTHVPELKPTDRDQALVRIRAARHALLLFMNRIKLKEPVP